MLPNRLLTTLLLRRGTRLWAITRVTISGLILLAGDDPLRLPVTTTVAVILLCGTLGYVEGHINHERDLLGNLGVRRRSVAPFFFLPALLGELLIRAAASAA